MPEALGGHHLLGEFLRPVLENHFVKFTAAALPPGTEFALMGLSVGGALLALIYAYIKYLKNGHIPVRDGEERSFLATLSYHKFYVDELYDTIIRKPLDAISEFLYKVVDKLGIDGLVNGIGRGPVEASKGLRLLQAGNVGFYIFMMVVGIIAVLFYSLGLMDKLHIIK